MIKIATGTITFSKCKTNANLNIYCKDIEKSGGVVLESFINAEKIGIVGVKVSDIEEFICKFKFTESYIFSDMCKSGNI